MNVDSIEDVVLATIALHNFRRKTNVNTYEDEQETSLVNVNHSNQNEGSFENMSALEIREYSTEFLRSN